jgi:hypothetical protein
MSEPVTVDAARFFEFIDRPGLAVLLISVHPRHTFSEALARQLLAEHGEIALGTTSLVDLVSTGGPAVAYLHDGFRGCGASTVGVLPGYCLFRQAEMLAWDSGLPTIADTDIFARSALIGLVFSGITNKISFVLDALRLAFDQAGAHRVAGVFREATTRRSYQRTTAQSSPPPADQTRWAYTVLGVQPTATDREVHQAWRRRRVEVHPDGAAGDPVEFERRSRISVDINRARDIIVAHRAHDEYTNARAA